MSFLRVFSTGNGGIMQSAQPGDTIGGGNVTIISANSAQTIAASSLTGQVILRQANASAYNDTTDTAVNIMQALYGNTSAQPKVGESFICDYSNQGTATITIVGGTGVTVSGNNTVVAGAMRRLLFTCTASGTMTFTATTGLYTNVGATFNCIVL